MEAEAFSLGGLAALPVMPDTLGQFPVQVEGVRLSTPSAEPPAPKAAPPSNEEVRKTAEEFGEALSHLNHGIHYEVDESTDRVITKIIDRETREVIRQIPPEEMMKMAHRLKRYVGVLLDTEV